jgi:hypothetical protein
MSKLFYQAMRTLPAQFVDDRTEHLACETAIFVVNPNAQPHLYTEAFGWQAYEPKFPPEAGA